MASVCVYPRPVTNCRCEDGEASPSHGRGPGRGYEDTRTGAGRAEASGGTRPRSGPQLRADWPRSGAAAPLLAEAEMGAVIGSEDEMCGAEAGLLSTEDGGWCRK